MSSLFDRIGRRRIQEIVELFYTRCMQDPMLAHFFWNIDHDHLVAQQVAFVSNLLGGPRAYQGPSLQQAHAGMTIRGPHFRRRQRILDECMRELGLADEERETWLALEERLKPLIVQGSLDCQS